MSGAAMNTAPSSKEIPLTRLARALQVLAAAVAMAFGSAQAQSIKIANIVELSGAGATSGTNFKNGVELAVKEINAAGVKVIADISTDQGQVDFSAPVQKAEQANADAIFVYLNEEESARALRELRKQGVTKPLVGETTLAGQKVIELAGDAANGAVAHVGLTIDAPSPAMRAHDQTETGVHDH